MIFLIVNESVYLFDLFSAEHSQDLLNSLYIGAIFLLLVQRRSSDSDDKIDRKTRLIFGLYIFERRAETSELKRICLFLFGLLSDLKTKVTILWLVYASESTIERCISQ